MGVKLEHAKCQPSTKGNIFKFMIEWTGGYKICAFSTENWPYLEDGDRYGLGYY